MIAEQKRMLILCKTYPSPSAKYVETSCVAGIDESRRLIRLFPVPFRYITDSQQFRKWQWISARVRKATEDHRHESHRISVDTIETLGEPIPTSRDWEYRRHAIEGVEIFDDFDALQVARETRGITLGLLRPHRLIDLRLAPAENPTWSAEEVEKLMQAQRQMSIFDQIEEQKSLKMLKKLPFSFHYEYECAPDGIPKTYVHKLVDWEAGALYWNIHRRTDWRDAFRQRFLTEFSGRDILFLMGTIHRFPDRWLIVSVLYFPRRPPGAACQLALL